MRTRGPKVMLSIGMLAVLSATAAAVVSPAIVGAKKPTTVDLQFLNVSDWHAQLDPISVTGVGNVGGAAVLSTYFDRERAANPNSLTLTGGDAYGASPPLSNFFNEVPAVQAMNLMGFDVDTFGNHNFDRGTDHLQEMIDLAEFQYVSANLKNRDDNLTGVKDFEIFDVGGVKVGVIGVTNPEAPTLVFPGSFGTIEVTDPVPAANKARAAAKKAGAQVLVAITHMGIAGFDAATGAAFGPLIDFADNVGGFDVIFGDHTDFEYSGIHNNALVVENRSKGLTYARTELTVQVNNGRVIDRSVDFITPLSNAVTPDPEIVNLLKPYRDQLRPIFEELVGVSQVAVPRTDSCGRGDGRLCESLLGNVVTDAMRLRYETDFAITNSGGLRAALTCPVVDNATDFCPPGLAPLSITRGQVLGVLPFGNVVVTGTVSGNDVKAFLERGVSGLPGAEGRFAQVSGLCFSYDVSAPVGSRVQSAVRQAGNGTCTGAPVDLTASSNYTIATNDFMAFGGDGYPVIADRTVSREIMDQVLADYVTAASPLSPSIQGRIRCTSSGAAACPVTVP